MESILSIFATIISSFALIGVAVGLVLQSRQLKAGQLQIVRQMHLELIKIMIENPALATTIYTDRDPAYLANASFLNFQMILLETNYSLKMLPGKALGFHVRSLFASEFARTWWATLARDTYEAEAVTKLEKEFLAIVDAAFQDVIQAAQ